MAPCQLHLLYDFCVLRPCTIPENSPSQGKWCILIFSSSACCSTSSRLGSLHLYCKTCDTSFAGLAIEFSVFDESGPLELRCLTAADAEEVGFFLKL